MSLDGVEHMADCQSTGDWKPVEFGVVDGILGSNQTFRLEKAHWPSWAHCSTQMQRLWVYCPDQENSPAVPGTTANVVARLLTERYDSKDFRSYNYNFYLISRSTDGRLYQSPPIRTSEPQHHSSAPPDWLESIGPPPL